MYYINEKTNMLVALLAQYGVKDVVLCPGSRNAMIVNNIAENGNFRVHRFTDERSAAFAALGMCGEDWQPVAVVVTSGSALMNCSPAVVEAYYRHMPLVVVSADRPQEEIGQNVGQTMLQADALRHCTRCSVNLTDAMGDTAYFNHRLVCEALVKSISPVAGPVHINVPLPDVSECEQSDTAPSFDCQPILFRNALASGAALLTSDFDFIFDDARRPILVVGQTTEPLGRMMMTSIRKQMVVLSEPLSDLTSEAFDGIFSNMPSELLPDLVIFVGDNMVCRAINRSFASIGNLKVWRVSAEGDFASPFMHLAGVVRQTPESFLLQMEAYLKEKAASRNNTMGEHLSDTMGEHLSDSMGEECFDNNFLRAWTVAFAEERQRLDEAIDMQRLSAAATVAYIHEQLEDMEYDYRLHYANSTSVRLACRYATGNYVYCNRGVNGIEGCVSTAAGHSLATDARVFCFTGDLAFLYDQNALWNSELSGNLRIVVFNDHRGSIFDRVKGLAASSQRETFIAGYHQADARGITTQNDIGYIAAKTIDEMHLGVVKLLTEETSRPMLLEVFLD